MSDHSEASYESRQLCEKLLKRLLAYIPQIESKRTNEWCTLFVPGGNRFAYVSHKKRLSRIEIWCAGDVDELTSFSALAVIPREKIKGGWEERFPARIVVDDEADILAACDLLFNISYKKS